MIELIGGSLYQWDIGRKVAVTPAEGEQIPEVHFANKGDSLAIPIAVENGEAKIPDILLQTGQPVTIYAVTLVAEGCESSVYNKVLPVKAKPKPEDYYYEEATRAVSEIKKITQMAEAAGIRAANAAENAVLCTEQELTPQQQAQVRENIDAVGSEQLDAVAAISSQGRSAKYDVLTPGWKRVLNVIRASNGILTFGVAKAIAGARSVQALGLVFTGNANFPTVGVDTEPLIYQLYDHEAGHNNTDDASKRARITKVRVGYPVSNSVDVDGEGGFSPTNPINCYVDVYVDFEPQYEGDQVQLNVNYAGFADSHNCEAISEETDAEDVGIYGETLTYSEFEPKKDYVLYVPGRSIWAEEMVSDTVQTNELHALNVPFTKISGTSSAPIILRNLDDGVYYPAGYGKSYADAETKSLQAGLYIVRQYTSYTAVIALLANSNHQVRWYRITEDASDEIVYDFDNFAAAVSFNAQTLTEEQQTQARENIGAISHGEDIDLKGKSLYNARGVFVTESGEDGFYATYGPDDTDAAVAEFHGIADDKNVRLKRIAPGHEDTDAVNKGQMYEVEKRLNLAVQGVLDDSGVGDRGWTSKNIVDKLCPAFTESGSMVTCEPVEGYPLNVVSIINNIEQESITLTQCGKNLFDFQQGVGTITFIGSDGTEKTHFGYALRLPAGTYTFHAEAVTGGSHYIYGVINDVTGAHKGLCNLSQGTAVFTRTVTLEQGDVVNLYDGYKRTIADANAMFACFNVQVEAGPVATDYEPYRGQTFTADTSGVEGSYAWSAIAALPGTNCLYSDTGNTTVTGRADPLAIISKQQATNDGILERLSALEAAAVNNT